MSSILKVYFYNLNVFANVEHEKFVLRKPNTSPITNHFAWRIMQKKKVCIGGSPSLCNVSVYQGSIPCESLNYAHFFWGRFTSCEFVHLLFYMTGSWCAVCVTHALILWPLSLAFLFVCLGFFSLYSLQLLLFYLGYVSLLLFISKEAVNVQVWDSVSLLPADVPKFTRSLLPLFILAFASKANLFTSLASKWLESMATNSVFFESSTTSIFLVFAFARFLSFVVIVSHCICGEISPVLLQGHALLLHHA